MQCCSDHGLKAGRYYLTITELAALRLRCQMQHPISIDQVLELAEKALALSATQTGRMRDVKEQLDLRGRFVDVLPSWSTAPHKTVAQFL